MSQSAGGVWPGLAVSRSTTTSPDGPVARPMLNGPRDHAARIRARSVVARCSHPTWPLRHASVPGQPSCPCRAGTFAPGRSGNTCQPRAAASSAAASRAAVLVLFVMVVLLVSATAARGADVVDQAASGAQAAAGVVAVAADPRAADGTASAVVVAGGEGEQPAGGQVARRDGQ